MVAGLVLATALAAETPEPADVPPTRVRADDFSLGGLTTERMGAPGETRWSHGASFTLPIAGGDDRALLVSGKVARGPWQLQGQERMLSSAQADVMGFGAWDGGGLVMVDGGLMWGVADGSASGVRVFGLALAGKQGEKVDWGLGVGRTMWKGRWLTFPAVFLAWKLSDAVRVSMTFPEGVSFDVDGEELGASAFVRTGGQTWGGEDAELDLSWVDSGLGVRVQPGTSPLRVVVEGGVRTGRTLGGQALPDGVWVGVGLSLHP